MTSFQDTLFRKKLLFLQKIGIRHLLFFFSSSFLNVNSFISHCVNLKTHVHVFHSLKNNNNSNVSAEQTVIRFPIVKVLWKKKEKGKQQSNIQMVLNYKHLKIPTGNPFWNCNNKNPNSELASNNLSVCTLHQCVFYLLHSSRCITLSGTPNSPV